VTSDEDGIVASPKGVKKRRWLR